MRGVKGRVKSWGERSGRGANGIYYGIGGESCRTEMKRGGVVADNGGCKLEKEQLGGCKGGKYESLGGGVGPSKKQRLREGE